MSESEMPEGRDVSIPDDRELTAEERTLVEWLLRHGHESALAYLDQLPTLRVVSRCECGCASINFPGWNVPGGMEILADYEYDGPDGERFGIYLFAYHSQLASLDVWSQDGYTTPTSLPRIDQLRPMKWAREP